MMGDLRDGLVRGAGFSEREKWDLGMVGRERWWRREEREEEREKEVEVESECSAKLSIGTSNGK